MQVSAGCTYRHTWLSPHPTCNDRSWSRSETPELYCPHSEGSSLPSHHPFLWKTHTAVGHNNNLISHSKHNWVVGTICLSPQSKNLFPSWSCMGTLIPCLSFPITTAGFILSDMFGSLINQGDIMWSFIKQNFLGLWPSMCTKIFEDNCQSVINHVPWEWKFQAVSVRQPSSHQPLLGFLLQQTWIFRCAFKTTFLFSQPFSVRGKVFPSTYKKPKQTTHQICLSQNTEHSLSHLPKPDVELLSPRGFR